MGVLEERKEREVEKQHRRIYFGDAFTEQMETWKRKNHKTEKDFAKRIGVHPNMVTNWKQGKSFPQAANMAAICAEFGIKESDFNPFIDFSGEYVRNAGRKDKSRYLQEYADANGLDEDFYSWLIKRPDFVRVFPFHSIETAASWQNVMPTEPPEDHPDEKAFSLVKFEFEDDYGHRKMMVKEDIDFILDIQEETKKHAVSFCLAEKERVREQRIELRLKMFQEDYQGALDVDEVKRQYFGTNFVDEETEVYWDKKLTDKVQKVAGEAGIRPRISIKKISMPVDEDKAAQMFRDLGYSEEEVKTLVQKEIEGYEWRCQHFTEVYKNKGYIIEEEESENG